MFSNNLAFAAKNPVDPASVKAKLQSRGVGHGVRVTMADNTEAKGLIVSLGDQSFAVKSKGAAQPREIQYAQVIGVHNDKIGTGTKIVIAVVIAGAVVGIVAASRSINSTTVSNLSSDADRRSASSRLTRQPIEPNSDRTASTPWPTHNVWSKTQTSETTSKRRCGTDVSHPQVNYPRRSSEQHEEPAALICTTSGCT